MKVREAIERLQEHIKEDGEDSEVFIVWWSPSAFGMKQNSEEWTRMVAFLNKTMDWSRTEEDMELLLWQFKNED